MQVYKIEVLEQAYDSLEEILNWIKEDNLFHAIQFREGVLNVIEKLDTFPCQVKIL